MVAAGVLISCVAMAAHAQAPSAIGGIHPNTKALIERPLRYQPQGDAFVIAGGAATVLDFALDEQRTLKSLTVRALANDVVIGLMAVTLARDDQSKVCMPRDAL